MAASIADMDFVKHRKGIEDQFEDGTVSFLSIASIRHGFRVLNTLTISAINRYGNSTKEVREIFNLKLIIFLK